MKGGSNLGGIHNLQQTTKGGQKTNLADTGAFDMNFRGNLEVGGPEDIFIVEIYDRTTRNQVGD